MAQTSERTASDAQQRMNFGVYFYHADDDKKTPEKEN
jgi:hypothetical protein